MIRGQLDVSENSGFSTQNHPWINRVFPCKNPSILGETPLIFGKTQLVEGGSSVGGLG